MRGLQLAVPAGRQPHYLRIARALRDALAAGRALPGEALPSLRRNTVIAALEELKAEGWIVGEERRALRVAATLPADYFRAGPQSPQTPPPDTRPHRWAWARRVRLQPFAPAAGVRYNFESGIPDYSLFPLREFRSHVADALRRARPSLLDYGDPRGLPSLLGALEDYLRRVRGVTGRRVVVTNGSQEGIFLAAQLLIRPGDAVAIEELSYPPAWETCRAAGARIVGIGMDREGIDADALDRAARRTRIRLLFLTPLHQFPTTSTLSVARRLAVYQVASRHGIVIFEDDYDHEYHYRTEPLPPLATYDPDERLVYASTLSKVLFPAARIGFLVVPPALERELVQFRRIVSHQNDPIVQDAIARWFASGGLERHLRRMRRHYEARRDAMVAALERARETVDLEWDTRPGSSRCTRGRTGSSRVLYGTCAWVSPVCRRSGWRAESTRWRRCCARMAWGRAGTEAGPYGLDSSPGSGTVPPMRIARHPHHHHTGRAG